LQEDPFEIQPSISAFNQIQLKKLNRQEPFVDNSLNMAQCNIRAGEVLVMSILDKNSLNITNDVVAKKETGFAGTILIG
jgi:hypothetical protein